MLGKSSVAHAGWLIVVLMSLSPYAAPRPLNAQQPDRAREDALRQLKVESATRTFLLRSRQKIASARKQWREGRHADSIQELNECLAQAGKDLGEQPNA